MNLIQLLLPLHDNEKQPFAQGEFESVRKYLTKRFGGVTFSCVRRVKCYGKRK